MNELHTYPIYQALHMTQNIPTIFNVLLDYQDDEIEMVELGVVDGEVVVRPVFTKDSPSVSSVHVPSTDWQKDKNIIVKAYDDEKRYTLSPWYVPQSVDAHGEWADRDEVQEAFWQYLALDNRDIRLQHNLDIVAGHWVEGCTWPHEVTVPVKHPDGDVEYTFPAGTPFLGVIWQPWAWELIKNGDLRGLSIGGQAERIEDDMDENAEYLPMGKVEFAKMISAEGGKYVVYSEDGNREFGTYNTLEEAEERLEQIEYFSNVDKATIEVGDTVGYTIPKPPDRNEIGRGVVTSITDDGTLTIPNTDESVEGTPDNPAVAVKVYFYDKDEWVESDRSIAKPMSELRIVQDFTKAEISESVKETLRNKVEEHNAKYTAAGKKATLRMLSASYRRGIGAYQGNPSSVRPSVSSAQQWAMGRVNGLLHALRTGKFKRKPYDTDLLPDEHPLATEKAVIKQDSYEPPKGVQENAKRALRWISEGHAGSGFTDVGRRRAVQLSNGQNVSTRTLARMKSFLSRHQSDKRAVGFHYGEKNFPSPGRVAYDAWGGEEGLRWASSILDRLEKHLPGKHDQSVHGAKSPKMVDDVPADLSRSPEAVSLAGGIREQALANEPMMTEKVTSIVEANGGEMDGLEHRVKSTDSLSRKIDADSNNDGVSKEEAAADISDSVRYTTTFSEADYTDGAESIVNDLEADGYEVRAKNFWGRGDDYNGINVKAKKNGTEMEIQIHTKASKSAKDNTHDLYKRKSNPELPKAERWEAWNAMVDIADAAPIPAQGEKLMGLGVQSFHTPDID